MAKAAEADRGFDLTVFAQIPRSHRRIDDADFPDIGVAIPDLRDYFDTWAKDLESNQLRRP